MVGMKRSQLKALIKECLIEILKENVELDVSLRPAVVSEAMAFRRPAQPALPAFINPMDDEQMMMRENQLYQQQALRRQNQSSRSRPMLPAPADDGFGGNDAPGPSSFNTLDTGTRNPSDYVRMAAQQQSRSRFDPQLDIRPGGGAPQQRGYVEPQRHAPYQQQPQQEPMLEASADTLRDIFADTAQTTMQEQATHGHVNPGHMSSGLGQGQGVADAYAAKVANSSPEELFDTSSWAFTAFDR